MTSLYQNMSICITGTPNGNIALSATCVLLTVAKPRTWNVRLYHLFRRFIYIILNMLACGRCKLQ